jgi:hypothetical protein
MMTRKRMHSIDQGCFVKRQRMGDIETDLHAFVEDSNWSSPEETLSLLRRDMEMLFSEIWNFEWANADTMDFDSLDSICSPMSSSPGSPTLCDESSWITPEPHSSFGQPPKMMSSQMSLPKLATCPPPTSPVLHQLDYIDCAGNSHKVNPVNSLSLSEMSLNSGSIDVGSYKPKPTLKNKPKTKSKQEKMLDYEDSDSYSGFGADSPNSKKRSRLPPGSVAIFRHWLFNHLESPYPSEEEKEELAHKAGLRITQVNNWFTNARRRILPREDGDSQGRSRSQ